MRDSKHSNKTALRSAIAFLVWIALALVGGFLSREPLTRVFGPDVWHFVALWAGSVAGLVNVLVVLIRARA